MGTATGLPMNKIRFAIFFSLVAMSPHGVAQLVVPPEPDRPLKLNATGSITHDSNLFRISDVVDPQAAIGSSDTADTIYRIGAGGSYEIRQSRQRFILEGNVDNYKFQHFSNLDYLGYDARGEWKWQLGNFWDGTLGLGHRRYLASFANIQANIKDLVDQGQVYGSANYQVYSRLRLTLDLNRYDYRHGDESQQIYNSDINNAAFTVNWVSPAENTVGVQYRTADATYPNHQVIAGNVVDNAYRENEFNVVANWRFSGLSTFQARLGHTERNYRALTSRNFSGPTWRLSYNWLPTGKLGFDFSTWREIGEYQSQDSNYVQITGISVIPTWSVTPNVSLQGKIARLSDKYLGDPGIVPVTSDREDTERIYQIAVLWTPIRRTTLTFSVEKGERTSNIPVFSYDYRTIGVTGVYTF